MTRFAASPANSVRPTTRLSGGGPIGTHQLVRSRARPSPPAPGTGRGGWPRLVDGGTRARRPRPTFEVVSAGKPPRVPVRARSGRRTARSRRDIGPSAVAVIMRNIDRAGVRTRPTARPSRSVRPRRRSRPRAPGSARRGRPRRPRHPGRRRPGSGARRPAPSARHGERLVERAAGHGEPFEREPEAMAVRRDARHPVGLPEHGRRRDLVGRGEQRGALEQVGETSPAGKELPALDRLAELPPMVEQEGAGAALGCGPGREGPGRARRRPRRRRTAPPAHAPVATKWAAALWIAPRIGCG